jgi:starch-binding outer membrane protein, SusD/RagB family
MKRISHILIFSLFVSMIMTSCDGLLGVDSDRYVFSDEYQMKSTNDTLYSMFGVFSQMEKIADSYILLGELRGDLMDVTENSSLALKEINNFAISSDNKYANNVRDYYSVINNCNYIIEKIDTSHVKGGVKVNYKTFAAAKAIRAWAYIQVALNYGTAVYYEKPLLNLEDAEANYPVCTMDELAPLLIADLEPWKDIAKPYFGNLYSHYSANSYFPIRFILGDLYLWTGQYDKAATEYHDLMFKEDYTVMSYYKSYRMVTNDAFTGTWVINWENLFESGSAEYITCIAASNEFGQVFDLDSLTWNYEITGSDVALNNWQSQMYYYSNALDTLGDLRIMGSLLGNVKKSTYGYTGYLPTKDTKNYIYKFMLMNPSSVKNRQIMPYRVALLYLRYAEAVNRLGKPNLAMAVLKNGLNKINMANRKIIPLSEIPDPLPDYMNFSDIQFDYNVGIRSRGLGNTDKDTTNFIIPANVDTMTYVEDLIINEAALETAFEGNRFHDLMRIAIRRNDNAYLAKKVAAKHKTNKDAIQNKLMNRSNWYLK